MRGEGRFIAPGLAAQQTKLKRQPKLGPFAIRIPSDHLPLLVAGAGVAIVALRLLILTDFDPDLAVAVMAAGDPGKIALATVTGIVPIAWPVITYLAVFAALMQDRSEVLRGMFLGVAVATLLLSILSTPANLGVVYLVLFIGLASQEVVLGNVREGLGDQISQKHVVELSRALTIQIAGTTAVLILSALVGIPPFLPLEHLALTDGTTMSGYIVSAGADQIVILADSDPKRLVELNSSRVTTQTLCRPPDNPLVDHEPAIAYLLGNRLPTCGP